MGCAMEIKIWKVNVEKTADITGKDSCRMVQLGKMWLLCKRIRVNSMLCIEDNR